MSARDKAKKAADVVTEALAMEREFEAPARGLVDLWRRFKAWRAKRKAARRQAAQRPLSQRDVDETKPQRRGHECVAVLMDAGFTKRCARCGRRMA